VDQSNNNGVTPLYIACQQSRSTVVSQLLAAGASVDLASNNGATPLYVASQNRHSTIVSQLLAAGASVDLALHNGATLLYVACRANNLACAQLLSSYRASRTFALAGAPAEVTAEDMATHFSHTDLAAWLATSRQWSTPLHHLTVIDAGRTLALLRDGADLHAAAVAGGPTPLSLAQAMQSAGAVADGSPAHLVLRAAMPWSPGTHELFPAGARARAVAVARLGYQLAYGPRFAGASRAVVDVWMSVVVPLAVSRKEDQQ